jgi:hypothetical protein
VLGKCTDGDACWYCRGAAGRATVRPQPYMIVEMECRQGSALFDEIVVAELTRETVDIVIEKIIPAYRKVNSGGFLAVAGLAAALGHGMYSGGASCGCGGEQGLCFACEGLSLCRTRFVVLDIYLGVYPFGEGHWLSCVTDGLSNFLPNCCLREECDRI